MLSFELGFVLGYHGVLAVWIEDEWTPHFVYGVRQVPVSLSSADVRGKCTIERPMSSESDIIQACNRRHYNPM